MLNYGKSLREFVYNFFWEDPEPRIIGGRNPEEFAKAMLRGRPKRKFKYGNLLALLGSVIIPITAIIITLILYTPKV